MTRLSFVSVRGAALVGALSCARAPAPLSTALGGDGGLSVAVPAVAPVASPAQVDAPAGSRGPYRAATFNAGLAVGVVRHATERAPLVIDAVASADVDLVCLQEVWLDEHWHALVSAAHARFPAAMRLEPTLAASEPRCTRGELAPLRACAKASCARLASDQLAACVIERCSQVAESVSVDCANCVARNPSGTLEAITEACVDPRDGQTPRLGARGGMVAYGGSYGLGLLTRSKVMEQDALRFRSVLNPRGVLYARVDALAGGLHVFCTHLTPDIAGLAHPTGGSFRRDHADEVQGLLAFIAEKTAGHGPVLLLGDLNAGPAAAPNIGSRLPDDYRRLLAAGFVNPYVASGRAECTFCNANPLVAASGAGGSLIDHVLVREWTGDVTVHPFLREPISLLVGGVRRRSAYSDHYGLVAALSASGS